MIRVSSILFWFCLALVASIGLYRTSDRVQELNRELTSLNTSIDSEQRSLHVLKAEWVYLASPSRLEGLAARHLALRPTLSQQTTTLGNLAALMPTRKEVTASVSVTGTPIANVHNSLIAPQPQPMAMNAAHDAKATHGKASSIAAASVDTSHVTDHMLMQRTASIQPPTDPIGEMLAQLDQRP